MTPDQLTAYRQAIRDAKPGIENLAQTRARLDRRIQTHPMPEGCAVEEVQIAGVACERLKPTTARTGRTLIYLHGGGYQVGSPRSHRFLAARLADTAACDAVVPDYRMAPEAPYPAAVDDALAVYRALLAEQPAERIVVGGDSAGAGLAVAVALAARKAGLPQPAGLLLISPWVDLAHEGTTYDKERNDTVTLAGLRAAAKSYAGQADLKDPLVSPMYGDLTGLPPMRIDVGSAEALLTDATRLAERAGAADVDVTLRIIPQLVHSYAAHVQLLSAVRDALDEAGAWIRARLS
jgi:monoterpene epsilon-lactone hydrolase